MRMVLLIQLLHKVGKCQLLDQEIHGFLVLSHFLEGCNPWVTLLWHVLTWSTLTLVLVIFPSACIPREVFSPLGSWFPPLPPFFTNSPRTGSPTSFDFFAVGLLTGPSSWVQLFPRVGLCFFSTSATLKILPLQHRVFPCSQSLIVFSS